MPWILIGANNAMRHFERPEQLPVCSHESVESRDIFFANGLWIYGATGAGFQVFENFCILKRKFQFVSIEYLENNDFVAVEAELLKAKGDVFRRLEEIGKKQYDTAPVDQPNRMLKKLRKARAARRLKAFEFAEHEAELVGTLGRADKARRGRNWWGERLPRPGRTREPLKVGGF